MDSSSTTGRAAGQRSYSLSFLLLGFLLLVASAAAQPVSLPFSFCAPSSLNEPDPLKHVNVTAIWGQLYHPDDRATRALKLTAVGEIGGTLEGYSNTTGLLGERRSLVVVRLHGSSSSQPRACYCSQHAGLSGILLGI